MLKYGRKLKVWLVKKNIKQKEFAYKMAVHVTTVSNTWIKKSKKPQEHNAKRINAYTNNDITMKDMGYD